MYSERSKLRLKIELGKILTESSLYVTNGKTEIQLDDIEDNVIDVNEGDTITIYIKQITKKEVRNSLLFFPLHIISAILRCVMLNVEKDYVEKKLEPYAIQCEYTVSKEDVDNGIIVDCFPSKYRSDSNMIYDGKIKINDVEQFVEQISNPLQCVKALNSFYMDMGWLVVAICALGSYLVGFGMEHLDSGRGIGSLVLGLILVISVLLTFIMKINADKRILNRVIAILEKIGSKNITTSQTNMVEKIKN